MALTEPTKHLISIGLQHICQGNTKQFKTNYIFSTPNEPQYPITPKLHLQFNVNHIQTIKSRLRTELRQYENRTDFIVELFCEYIQRKQVTCMYLVTFLAKNSI